MTATTKKDDIDNDNDEAGTMILASSIVPHGVSDAHVYAYLRACSVFECGGDGGDGGRRRRRSFVGKKAAYRCSLHGYDDHDSFIWKNT